VTTALAGSPVAEATTEPTGKATSGSVKVTRTGKRLTVVPPFIGLMALFTTTVGMPVYPLPASVTVTAVMGMVAANGVLSQLAKTTS
jgi:tRNA A37 threonylcarbamoyladenosine dehydratase